MTACKICGGDQLQPGFTAMRAGVAYESRYCPRCRAYQTIGDVPAVSPDYVDLEAGDLDAPHRFLQTAHKLPAFEQWAALVRPRAGERLLEVGCGIGGFLDFARARGLEAYGFDASAAQVGEARARHPRVELATGVADYAARLATPVRFDHVVLWDVLEHLRDPARLLAELRNVMAPDGRLFVSVPSAGPVAAKLAIGRLTGRDIAGALIPWEHVFYHSRISLARLFTASRWCLDATGGVATYVRAPSPFEYARRVAHRLLRRTPLAFQLFALARPLP